MKRSRGSGVTIRTVFKEDESDRDSESDDDPCSDDDGERACGSDALQKAKIARAALETMNSTDFSFLDTIPGPREKAMTRTVPKEDESDTDSDSDKYPTDGERACGSDALQKAKIARAALEAMNSTDFSFLDTIPGPREKAVEAKIARAALEAMNSTDFTFLDTIAGPQEETEDNESENDQAPDLRNDSSDESDGDLDEFAVFIPELINSRQKNGGKRLSPPGRTDRQVTAISTTNWSVSPCGSELPTHVVVTDASTGMTAVVFKARVKKAMLALDHFNIVDCLHPVESKCRCKRECYDNLTRKEIIALRTTMAGLANGTAVQNYLMNNIRSDGGIMIKGKIVCIGYYAKVHSAGETTVRAANRTAKMGAAALGGRKPTISTGRHNCKQTMHAKAFWRVWFDTNCQKPNDDVRLFPVNTTYREIWTKFFEPWWNHQGHPKSEKPAARTWENARHDKEFEDVQRRAKHYHCRCNTCASLEAQQLTAFSSRVSLAKWQQAWRLHREAIRKWRDLEAYLEALAIQSPEDMILLSYDDTGELGFPNLTNRPLKSQGNTRFGVVPWLMTNHGVRKRNYVYMPKHKWSKGANRIITQLHATVSAIKSDPTSKQHGARRLVVIADNYSENKNKEILAYISDLCLNKWFDSVELIFGEVGHTHNGNDATHKVHNVDVGNFEAGDLGHFVFNYQKVWADPITRPRASLLDRMYDWVAYYRPHIRGLSGVTKTAFDEYTVRGFRASRNRDGLVDLTWKVDPATEKGWRGQDGQFGSAGFQMLQRATSSVPKAVRGKIQLACDEYCNKLLSQANSLEPFGLMLSARANYESAKTGIIPITKQLEHEAPAGEWGPLCTMGSSPDHQGYVRLLNTVWWKNDENTVWALPETTHAAALSHQFHYSGDQALIDARPLPYVRYMGTKASDAPVYNHANNVARRANLPALLQPAADEPAADAPGDWEGDGADASWVVNMKKCQKGSFAVIQVLRMENENEDEDDDNGGNERNSIELYKIVAVDTVLQTFEGVMWECSRTQLTDACLGGTWHTNTTNKGVTLKAKNVIDYFKVMIGNRKNKLPTSAVKAIQERGVYTTE